MESPALPVVACKMLCPLYHVGIDIQCMVTSPRLWWAGGIGPCLEGPYPRYIRGDLETD